jgi:hypothetical protein
VTAVTSHRENTRELAAVTALALSTVAVGAVLSPSDWLAYLIALFCLYTNQKWTHR